MKLVVQDACIIIDLIEGSLLELWPGLGFETITSDLVVHEIKDPEQKKAFDSFKSKKGISIINLKAEELIEVVALQRTKGSGLTLSDCSALFLARKKDAILLTSDGMLRKKAERDHIEVRGLLWVLDSLIEAKLITSKNAASNLKRILDAGSRLPADECSKRFDAWK
jgi:predicted nucleic acid-binding protein